MSSPDSHLCYPPLKTRTDWARISSFSQDVLHNCRGWGEWLRCGNHLFGRLITDYIATVQVRKDLILRSIPLIQIVLYLVVVLKRDRKHKVKRIRSEEDLGRVGDWEIQSKYNMKFLKKINENIIKWKDRLKFIKPEANKGILQWSSNIFRIFQMTTILKRCVCVVLLGLGSMTMWLIEKVTQLQCLLGFYQMGSLPVSVFGDFFVLVQPSPMPSGWPGAHLSLSHHSHSVS